MRSESILQHLSLRSAPPLPATTLPHFKNTIHTSLNPHKHSHLLDLTSSSSVFFADLLPLLLAAAAFCLGALLAAERLRLGGWSASACWSWIFSRTLFTIA